jgi:hypothetical protein
MTAHTEMISIPIQGIGGKPSPLRFGSLPPRIDEAPVLHDPIPPRCGTVSRKLNYIPLTFDQVDLCGCIIYIICDYPHLCDLLDLSGARIEWNRVRKAIRSCCCPRISRQSHMILTKASAMRFDCGLSLGIVRGTKPMSQRRAFPVWYWEEPLSDSRSTG